MTTASGDIIAGVGDDTYADEWIPTWMLPIEGMPVVIASSGGVKRDEIAHGVRRIMR